MDPSASLWHTQKEMHRAACPQMRGTASEHNIQKAINQVQTCWWAGWTGLWRQLICSKHEVSRPSFWFYKSCAVRETKTWLQTHGCELFKPESNQTWARRKHSLVKKRHQAGKPEWRNPTRWLGWLQQNNTKRSKDKKESVAVTWKAPVAGYCLRVNTNQSSPLHHLVGTPHPDSNCSITLIRWLVKLVTVGLDETQTVHLVSYPGCSSGTQRDYVEKCVRVQCSE